MPSLFRRFLPFRVGAPSSPLAATLAQYASHLAAARSERWSNPDIFATAHGGVSSTRYASAMTPSSRAFSMSLVYSATYHPIASAHASECQSSRSGHNAATISMNSGFGLRERRDGMIRVVSVRSDSMTWQFVWWKTNKR